MPKRPPCGVNECVFEMSYRVHSPEHQDLSGNVVAPPTGPHASVYACEAHLRDATMWVRDQTGGRPVFVEDRLKDVS